MLCCAQSCLTLCNSMDYGLPGSSVYGIFQARILERVAISHSRGSFQPRDQIYVSCFFCIGRRILEPPGKLMNLNIIAMEIKPSTVPSR